MDKINVLIIEDLLIESEPLVKTILANKNLYACGTFRYGQRECEEAIATKQVEIISKEFCDLLLNNSNQSNCATFNIINYSLVSDFNQVSEMWVAQYNLSRNKYLNQS